MFQKVLLLLTLASFAFADASAEVQALCDIKNTLNPFLWIDNVHSPCEMTSPCQYNFAGVVCDEQKEHIIKLNLYTNGMEGKLPESIVNLSSLEVLDMRENRISGPLPDLSALSNLQTLDFSKTLIDSGSIPEWICNLKNLVSLGLEATQRTGSIPSCLYSLNLNSLNLANNLLEGSLSEIFNNYSNLKSFDISNNYKLTSENPSEILCSYKATELHHLKLSNINLSGALDDCANTTISNLYTLDLSQNNLSGNVPVNFINACSSLVLLNLGSNKFDGDFDSISVPSCDVSYNKLTCTSDSDSDPCGCKVAQNYTGYDPKYSPSLNAVIITMCVLSIVAFCAVFVCSLFSFFF